MAGDRILRVIIAGDAAGGIAALERFNVGLERSHEEAAKHGSGISGAFTSMATKAALVAAGLTVTAGVIAEELYKMGAPYEQLLNQIQAFTHVSNEQIQQLAAYLYQISPQLALYGLTSEDAADAIVKLTKAGLSLKDAQIAVLPTLTLAKAGMIDSGEAANYAAEAMNVWGLKASQMTMVANALVGASHSSTASVTDLGDSMSYSAAAAAHAGLSFQQTAAFLAEVANAGVQGSKAGTALKDMLVNLEAPTSSASKALKALGINVYDAHGKMKDFGAIIGLLHDKLSKLSQQQQAIYIKDIFGKIPMESALTIVKGGAAAYQKYLDLVSRTGEASDIAGAKSKGLSGAIARVRAQFESMGQALYLKVAPTFTRIVNGFADALPKAADGAAKLEGFIAKAFSGGGKGGGIGADLKSTFQPVLSIVHSIGNDLRGVFNSAKSQGVFAALLKDGKAIAGVVKSDILPMIKQLASFVETKLMPVVRDVFEHKILPGIKAVAGFISGTLVPKFHSIIQALQPVVVFVENWIVGKLVPLIKWAIDQLKPVFKEVGGVISSLLDFLAPFVRFLTPIIEWLVNTLSGPAIGAVKGFFNGAVRVISGLLHALKGILDFLTGVFTLNWSKMWHGITEIFSGLFNALIGIAKVLIFGKLIKIFLDGGKAIIDAFKGAGKGLISLVENIGKFIVGLFKKSTEEQVKLFIGGWKLVIDGIGKAISWIVDFLKGGWRRILADITNWLRDTWANVQRGFNEIVSTVVTKMADFLEAVLNAGEKVMGWFKDLPGKVTGAVKGFGDLLVQAGKDLINGLIKGIKSLAGGAIDAVKGVGKGIVNGFKSILHINSPSRVFDTLGQGTMQGYVNGITKMIPNVRDAMNKLGSIRPSFATNGTLAVGLSNAALRLALPTGVGAAAAAAGGAGNGALIVNLGGVTVKGNVTTDKELAESLAPTVRDAIRKIGRKNGGRTGL